MTTPHEPKRRRRTHELYTYDGLNRLVGFKRGQLNHAGTAIQDNAPDGLGRFGVRS